MVATESPIKSNTTNDKIKKEQRVKLTVTITAAMASDTIKNQLKSMHAKDIIYKCQSAIAEHFKEGHIPKIHGINKLSNDEYEIQCESKDDPQLLSSMDWNSIFNEVRTKTRKYGLVVHGVSKKDLVPINENETTLRDDLDEENISRNLSVAGGDTPQTHAETPKQNHRTPLSSHLHTQCERNRRMLRPRYIQDSTTQRNIPELNITQCYKFGHLAKHCKSEATVEIRTTIQPPAPIKLSA